MHYFSAMSNPSNKKLTVKVSTPLVSRLQIIDRHIKSACRQQGFNQIKRVKNTFTIKTTELSLPLLDSILCSIYGEWKVAIK